MSARLSRAIDFIKAHQNPDGGWGYEAGRMSFVEPTAFCLLAIHSSGDTAGTARGLEFLRTCQQNSGGVGAYPKDANGSWMAYAALLAFHVLGATEEERRLKSWILSFQDASGLFTKEDLAAAAALNRYDASIPGWSWTPRTTAWVEPTALSIIALIRTGVSATEKRIKSGVDLILDRRVPSGGWNFGNPYSKSYELAASPMPTALAVAALGAAGVPEGRPAVGAGIRFLARSLAEDVSTASLAWILLALRSYPSGTAQAPGVAARLARIQRDDGGFRGNFFETALAFLVLGDGPILRPVAGRNE
jgi:hypothetical protein